MTLTLATGYTPINCGKCGGGYAIGTAYYEDCRAQGRSWHCPYCDTGWGFADRGEVADLKAQLERKQRDIDFWREQTGQANSRRDEEKRRAAAARGQVTRIRNRVGNGVCPCCSRSFKDLAAHMKTKHPKWKDPAP